jgi:hypothetical protein
MLSTALKHTCGLVTLTAALLGSHLASAAAPNGMLAPVTTMYRTFAWEALSSDTDLFGNGLAAQPAGALAQYFEPQLAKMIADDAACQRRTQAFCKLDFDILFDSQDPRIVDLSIEAGPSNTVYVSFKDPVTDKETRITYMVGRGANGWRINDVVYAKEKALSLRALFSARAKGDTKAKSK